MSSVEVNFQRAIQKGNYTAEAVFFEDTKKNWRGENYGRGVCKQVCITPYKGEDHVFTPSHPDFVAMFDRATECSHGLHWSEEAITEDNLETFSRTVLAHGYIEDPMARIRKAIKLIDGRKAAQRKAEAQAEVQAILEAHGIQQ